jgi:hypothetical protein
MKTISRGVIGAALLLAALSASSMADDNGNSVSWETLVGTFFIPATPPATGSINTVGGIVGGGEPWSTLGGHAYVDLSSGIVDFQVRGLVLAGGSSIGTPGAVTQVTGALVCSPASSPTVFFTPAVNLSAQGNAEFHGSFSSSTAGCSATNVAFLITTVATTTAPSHWLANGAVRVP